jgi:RNA polymerase sigma-70 factor (ECF subfamily)
MGSVIEQDLARQHLAAQLARVALGDRAALAEVYRLTSAKLFGVCLRILEDRAEAEDVLQQVYLTVWQKAGGFDATRASPITWLVAIARNRSIDRRRARGPSASSAPIEAAAEVSDPAPSALARLEESDERRRLADCLRTLEEKHASAIRRAFFDGLTYEELARAGGVPLGTMKSWIRRGLMKLKECLGP